MAHEEKVINGFEVHYFDDFTEAQSWLRELQGPKAQFISYISRQDVFHWAEEIDTSFNGKQYLPKDLLKIIKERNADVLSNIHPEYFLYLTLDLSKEDTEFLAENLSVKQVQGLPTSFLRRFTIDELETILKKVKSSKILYHKVYTIRKKNKTDKSVFVKVEIKPLDEWLISKIDYKKTYVPKEKKERIPLDLSKEYLTDRELADYLSINIQYFKQLKRDHKDSLMCRIMGVGVKSRGKLLFKTSDFKEFMKKIYVPKSGEPCEDESLYLPKDGLYSPDSLIEKFGVASTVTRRTLKHARYDSTISCFKVSEKYYRYSYNDFKNFIKKRADDHINIQSNMIKDVIQFPKNSTEQQKKNILNQYITVDELANIIPFTSKLERKTPNNLAIASFMKLLTHRTIKYKNRMDDKLYFKRDAIVDVIRERYGYYGTYKTGQNPIDVPYDLDFNYLYKKMKEGDKERGVLYSTIQLKSYLSKKYDNFPDDKFAYCLNSWIKKGKVPVLFINKNSRRLYIPHLEECEVYQDFLKEYNLKLAD